MSAWRTSRRLAVSVLAALLTATGVVATGAARAAAAPPAPTGLTVTATTSTSVTLTWTSGGGDVAGYYIGARQTYNDVVGPGMRVDAVTTATLTGLRPTGEYAISVSSIDREGAYSPSSNTLLVATPATDTGPDTTIPGTPANVRAIATATGATLDWDPATDNVGVTGYNVYRYDGMFAAFLVATVTGTTYSGSRPGDRQFYFVRARDAAGNLSLTSNTAGSSLGPPSPSTPTPAPTPTCRVTYRVTSEWAQGFVAELTIANTGTSTVNGWTLGFTFTGGQRVVRSWPGSFTQSGAAVTVKPARWTSTIAPGGQVGAGLLGTRTAASNLPPTAFTLNGAPCSTG
jgi:hypothetical protein